MDATKNVILAEKPSQAKDYANAYDINKRTKHYIEIKPNNIFKEGALITWAVGHLLELDFPQDYDEKYARWNLDNLPINIDTFNYSVPKDKKTHYAEIVKMFKRADAIVNGTDADRAGEAIFYNIIHKENLNDKTFKRLWINSQTVKAVQEGMENLLDGSEKYNLAIEERARQKSDWLIGMNLSPLFTLLLQSNGYQGKLGIGRVMCPTVYLIYERQKEIENFKETPFFQIEGYFESDDGSYKGMAEFKENDKEKISQILQNHNITGDEKGFIQSISKKEDEELPPKLHSLDTLQKSANDQWKYDAKDVLQTVQELYDKKILTYPRTESNYITENEFYILKENINNYMNILDTKFEPKSLEPNKRYVDSNKVKEHYAIVPTEVVPEIDKFTEKQKNIYMEVLATTLSMFHHDYKFEKTTIVTNVNDLEFKTTGKVEKDKGWKHLFPNKFKNNKDSILPNIHERDEVTSDINIKEGITKPPKPYTEGQLLNMMITCGKHVEDEEEMEILKETHGIGTNATRADIIEKVKKENYISVKNNKVYVTSKGAILCKSIEGTLLASPSMTAKWENYLTKIGEGEGSEKIFIDKINQFINKMISEMPEKLNTEDINNHIKSQNEENSIAKCPSCDGSIEDKGKFYGCSEYKEGCKVTFPKKLAGKAMSKKMIQDMCSKNETSKLKGFKSKKGKTFDASLKLDENFKMTFNFNK